MSKKEKTSTAMPLPLVRALAKTRFGYQYETAKNLPDHYIVLSNHVTGSDSLLISASFPDRLHFVETITDPKAAAAEILQLSKGGSNVCFFPEGSRTWDGVTGPIAPETAGLIKRTGCALVTYKIQGGYFFDPIWSCDGPRRGPISGHVMGVYPANQLQAMSADEIHALITRDLHEDAYERQLRDPMPYRGKSPASELENLLFLCPNCGRRNSLTGVGDMVCCNECGLSFTYDEYGMLHGVPFKTLRDYAAWQKHQVAADAAAGNIYAVEFATLNLLDNNEATQIAAGYLSMSSTSLCCDDYEIPMEAISNMVVHGRHSLAFSANQKHYLLLPAHEFSIQQFKLYFDASRNLM